MFTDLTAFQMASHLIQHSVTRQGVIAQNIANADTPEYRAKDVVPFAQSYESGLGTGLRTTRHGHDLGLDQIERPQIIDMAQNGAPNGNTVSLEREMMRSVDTERQYDLALGVYKSTLSILRGALGRR